MRRELGTLTGDGDTGLLLVGVAALLVGCEVCPSRDAGRCSKSDARSGGGGCRAGRDEDMAQLLELLTNT